MFLEKTRRKIVPRWRDFLTTLALGELDPGPGEKRQSLSSLGRNSLLELKSAWLANKTLWHALDLLSGAFVLGRSADDDVQLAARFVNEHRTESPGAGVLLASKVLNPSLAEVLVSEVDEETVGDLRAQIHFKRRQLTAEPRNAVAWIDLARLYTVLGHLVKARSAIQMACKLVKDNRFILRSVSRYYIHVGELDGALDLLRNSDVTDDPWIIAAEIGVSSFAEESPHSVRQARRLIEDANFSPFATTELASALATQEVLDGRHKLARKLFRRSLTHPTENSLAQAEWASNEIGDLEVNSIKSPVPRNYEAKALRGLSTGDWELGLKGAVKWLRDQPFSSRPAGVVSYLLSSILERYEESEPILRLSLKANPGDRVLTNNMAFTLLNLGRIQEAEQLLKDMPPDAAADTSSISLLATNGLALFRRGAFEEGRSLYLAAMDRARQLSEHRYEALAAIHLAREEVRANLPTKMETLKLATELGQKQSEPDVQFLLTRLLKASTPTV